MIAVHNTEAMPSAQRYRGRRAVSIENKRFRVTVLQEGGHIAEMLDKETGVNPLWTPIWPSIEPSAYDRATHPMYGGGVDAQLLAGIMGHNLCLDIFGAPSAEEAAAGMPVHGEASVARFRFQVATRNLVMQTNLPLANLRFERKITLEEPGIRIQESVINLGGTDRPVGWTEHVTLGPPFLKRGVTEFRASATRSKVIDGVFGTADYLEPGAEFEWPQAPRRDRGGTVDMRVFSGTGSSSAFTSHLMDTAHTRAFFSAFEPESRHLFGYVWRRADFPWLGIWEENCSRAQPPWNGGTITRGLEFGVSPVPESRRQMIERGRLFETPAFRWIPATSRVDVEYWVISRAADRIPETLEWPA
jgi:hypothetical protein